VHPDPVSHISVDDQWPALDHAHWQTAMNLAFYRVELHEVEDQRFAGDGGLPADADPLVRAIVMHGGVGEHPKHAGGWFRQSESFVASSIGHGHRRSNGHTEWDSWMEYGKCEDLVMKAGE
jgi:hypothetical protein